MIRRISQNQVEKVVVLYKDRLLRFGFELIEYIASLYNCEIEIIDNTEKSEQQELVEDLVQNNHSIQLQITRKTSEQSEETYPGIDTGGNRW